MTLEVMMEVNAMEGAAAVQHGQRGGRDNNDESQRRTDV